MCIEAMSDVWKHSQQTGANFLTLLYLAWISDARREISTHVSAIADGAHISKRKAQQALAALQATGEIIIVERARGRAQRHYIRITSPADWAGASPPQKGEHPAPFTGPKGAESTPFGGDKGCTLRHGKGADYSARTLTPETSPTGETSLRRGRPREGHYDPKQRAFIDTGPSRPVPTTNGEVKFSEELRQIFLRAIPRITCPTKRKAARWNRIRPEVIERLEERAFLWSYDEGAITRALGHVIDVARGDSDPVDARTAASWVRSRTMQTLSPSDRHYDVAKTLIREATDHAA